jgi:hypothetical protein
VWAIRFDGSWLGCKKDQDEAHRSGVSWVTNNLPRYRELAA